MFRKYNIEAFTLFVVENDEIPKRQSFKILLLGKCSYVADKKIKSRRNT